MEAITCPRGARTESGTEFSLARLRCVWLVVCPRALRVNKGAATADRGLVCVREENEARGRCWRGQGDKYGYRESSVGSRWLETHGLRDSRKGSQGSQAAPSTYFLVCVFLVSWKVLLYLALVDHQLSHSRSSPQPEGLGFE